MIEIKWLCTGELWIKDTETGEHGIIAPYNIYKFLKRHPDIAKHLLEEELEEREREIENWVEEFWKGGNK